MEKVHEKKPENRRSSAINEAISAEARSYFGSSKIAKDVIPYLSLQQLDPNEDASILQLSEKAIATAINDGSRYDAGDYYDFFGDKIAEIVGEEKEWRDGRIPLKLQEARKLFCAGLFESFNRTNDLNEQEKIRRAFFSMSPDFASYCGGLRDSLEMLTIAERSNSKACTNSLKNEIIYNTSFSAKNDYEKALNVKDPLRQLWLIQSVYDISKYCWPDDWSGVALNKISDAVWGLANNKESTAMVKLVASHVGNLIDNRFSSEYVLIEPNDPMLEEIMTEETKIKDEYDREQEDLRADSPSVPNNKHALRIAPGVTGILSGEKIDRIISRDGRETSLSRYAEAENFELNRNAYYTLGTAHSPEIKPLISEKLGIDLADIPLNTQVRLLDFMTNANEDRFERLCLGLHNIRDDVRVKVAEGFLAAEFGDDFGDSLIQIAHSERISDDDFEKVLDKVNECRESISKITKLYKGFDDGKFAPLYSLAANERLTDIITVFGEIAKNGYAGADLAWAGDVKFDFGSALEALDYETKSLAIASGVMADVMADKEGAFAEVVLTPNFETASTSRTLYNFYSPDHGYMLLYTRPEGSHSFDSALEYGKYRNKYDEAGGNAGVEASISMTVNPVEPFELPNPLRPHRKDLKNPNFYDPKTMNKVSAIRLDREGRAPGAAADDPERDPLNPLGTISVDLAAIGDRADTPSGKIARLISVGNKLRADATGTDFSLNHNTRWFAQNEFGTDEGFASLVSYVDSLALDLCKKFPPSKNEGFRAKFREASRRRGKKGLESSAT